MTTQRQKIAGKYTLWAVIPNSSYTFTGNNRAANFGITGDELQAINMKALNSLSIDSNVWPEIGTEVKIKRAKIEPSGAFGLQPSPGERAAGVFVVLTYTDEDANLQTLSQISMQFDKWGEWCEINKSLKAYGFVNPDSCYFGISSNGAFFTCDDYNLQKDYIGQTVTPVLVMEVETAGLYDSVARVKF